MPVTFETMIVDGRTVRYIRAGNPAVSGALVLIHGYPLGVRMWEPQLSAFDGWHVVAPALAGFDGTDVDSQPSMDAYARQVVELIEGLRSTRVVVAGLSMGGYVAFSVLRLFAVASAKAEQASDRIAGLILADTRSGVDSPEGTAGRRRMLDLVARGGAKAVADELIPKLLGRTSVQQRPEIVAVLRRMIESQSADAISAATRAMMARADSGSLLPSLRMPALILVGEEDTLTPPSESESMHQAIAGSTLIRIPEAGHMSNLEAPAAFNAAVSDFLRRI